MEGTSDLVAQVDTRGADALDRAIMSPIAVEAEGSWAA
jgi:hypothetical protein